MDKQQEALLRGRPWSLARDDEDQRAVDLAKTDHDLSALKARSDKFNQRVRDELAATPVPADLRSRLLAGRKVVRVEGWGNPRRLLAMAATVLFLATALFFWTRPQEDQSIAGFRSRMVGFALREYRMDVLTKDLSELKRFLALKGVPAEFALPPKLAATPLKGGARLSWQGKPVSMVCFDRGDGDTIYLFVLAREGDPGEPSLVPVKNLTTATWSAGGKTFVVAGHLPAEQLAQLVKS